MASSRPDNLKFRDWAETEPKWDVRMGQDWAYDGDIHESTTAHITYWIYKPPETQTTRPHPKKGTLALKTTYNPYFRRGFYPPSYNGPRSEGSFLSVLSPANSPHIIRQYRPPILDPDGNEVKSLECVRPIDKEWRNNNLSLLIKADCQPLHEVDVWDIFSQFVKMVNVLDRGAEDVNVQRWNRGEIWHCDINPKNGELVLRWCVRQECGNSG